MKIFKAESVDLQTSSLLFDLYRQFYEQKSDINSAKEFLSERILNNESVIFLAVCEQANDGMGFVQLYPSFSSVSLKKIWILNDLFVHKSHRRKGVAEALIEKSRMLCIETDAKGLILETHKSNADAQRLYDKTGFKKDEDHFYYILSV